MLIDFQLEKYVIDLETERPVFFSEADFQMSLARLIAKKNPSIQVMLEYPYYVDSNNLANSAIQYFDILLTDEDSFVVIELKYRQKKLKEKYTDPYTGLPIYLKEHSAQDQGCFQFWNDVHRIEKTRARKTIGEKKFAKGYSLMLTNDPRYWIGPRNENISYNAFRLKEEREVKEDAKMAFREGTAKSSNGDKSFEIQGCYKLLWKDYSNLFDDGSDKKNGKFRYLLLEIEQKKNK